jgi:hypothetical protein
MPQLAQLEEIAATLEYNLTERVKHFPGDKRGMAAQLLLGAKNECGASGIGAVIERGKGIDLIYLDLGDSRRDTIVYDAAADMFLVTAWADLVDIYCLVNDYS